MPQRHAVLVERDDRRFEIEIAEQLIGGLDDFGRVRESAAGGQSRFQAIRGDRGATVVFAIIAAASRIGDDANALRLRGGDGRGQQVRRAYALVVVADQHDVGMVNL
jgi:hypothetical protein